MEFRVGHDVRYEILIDAPNAAEAERLAAGMPYDQWKAKYQTEATAEQKAAFKEHSDAEASKETGAA